MAERPPKRSRGPVRGTSLQANTNNALVPYNAPQSNAQTQTENSGANPKGGLNFTQIKDHAPEKSPFTETRTVLHEWTGYLSMNGISKTLMLAEAPSPENAFYINMNNPYNVIEGTLVGQAVGLSPIFGISCTQSAESATYNLAGSDTNSRVNFPRRLVGETNFNEPTEAGVIQGAFPTWLRWYQKMYRYYHVIEANYKITARYANYNSSGNAEGTAKRDAFIAIIPESYTADNNSDITPSQIVSVDASGNQIIRMIGLHQLKKFKNVQLHPMDNPKNVSKDCKDTVVITGSWKPGQREGSVKNLEDIKQWYPVGAPPSPAWNERIKVAAISGTDATAVSNINLKIEVSYKIQYKDLQEIIKYAPSPTWLGEAVILRCGIDDIQFPYPVENHLQAPYNPATGTWTPAT
jgi:hypothetical protein